VRLSSKSAIEISSQQQAADFLRNQIPQSAEQLLKDFPGDPVITKNAVRFYWRIKDPHKAITLLEQGIKKYPKYFELYILIARVFNSEAEYDNALFYWKKAKELLPENQRWMVSIYTAQSLIFSGRYVDAVQELDNIEPSNHTAQSYYLLGQAYLQLKDYDKAKECYQNVLEINPRYPNANHQLGTVYMRLKQPDKAMPFMEINRQEKARETKNMQDGEARIILEGAFVDLTAFPKTLLELYKRGVWLYKTRNNPDKALEVFKEGEQIFQKTIKLSPSFPGLYRDFALFYKHTNGDLAKAKEYNERAEELVKSAKKYFESALEHYNNSELSSAVKDMKKASELDPEVKEYKIKYHQFIKERTK
jgi:tetratricopeptide (TPR) repeat protein